MDRQELDNTVEALIDRTSVREVLEAMENICQAKSDHISETWQDKVLALVWSRTATKLRNARKGVGV